MPDDDAFDALIDAVAPLLGIAIDPHWRPAIRTHLGITLLLANRLAAFPLPDEIDPAPVFRA
jgi:hypothetical protein